jgi:hypothetical protein
LSSLSFDCCCWFCSRWGSPEAGVFGGIWGRRGVCLTVSMNLVGWGVDVSLVWYCWINCSSISRISIDVRPVRFLIVDDDGPTS